MTRQPVRKPQYDVFLSHHSADKPLVEMLAARLADEGLKPFLDRWHLVPGEPWPEALEEALENSRTCAVFLGSSGLGPWENEEMRIALDERVRDRAFRVIPVLLPKANAKDPATLPRFLRRVTWVDFRSGFDDEAFRRLVAGIRGEAPGRGLVAAVGEGRIRPTILHILTSALKHVYPLLLLVLPTLVVIIMALVLMNWRIPTRIYGDLTVSRAAFTVGGNDSTRVLNSLRFQSITAEKFARFEFRPQKVEVANPVQYDPVKDSYPDSAWKSLTVSEPWVITGEDETLHPSVTMESPNRGLDVGTLDRVRVRPGAEVILETRGVVGSGITVKVERQQPSAALIVHEPFRLTTHYGQITGVANLPYRADALTYRAQLFNHSPEVEISGQPDSLVFVIVMSREKAAHVFSTDGIPVTALDFTRQDETGNRITALVRDGEISYPDYPKLGKIFVKASDFIGLDRLERFRIEQIALDREHQGIRFRLNGVTGHVRTGSAEFPKDHRLTRLDAIWQNPRVTGLLSLVAWALPTSVGAYKLYREVKG
jgi:hypothetical protein